MKANAIRLYKHHCEMVENPKGNDSQERALVRGLAKRAKADMENHFRTGRKYQGDPEILELLNGKPEKVIKKEEPKEELKEEKTDGKKPKG